MYSSTTSLGLIKQWCLLTSMYAISFKIRLLILHLIVLKEYAIYDTGVNFDILRYTSNLRNIKCSVNKNESGIHLLQVSSISKNEIGIYMDTGCNIFAFSSLKTMNYNMNLSNKTR